MHLEAKKHIMEIVSLIYNVNTSTVFLHLILIKCLLHKIVFSAEQI